MQLKTKWMRPSQMAKKYGKSLQIINYWKHNGNLEVKEGEYGITLVRETKRLITKKINQ